MQSELDSYLCHGLLVSKSDFLMFQYDQDSDILLESIPIDFFSLAKELLSDGILILWLAMNYFYACSGVTSDMKSTGFTAQFPKQAGTKIERYRKAVELECGKANSRDDLLSKKN